MRTEPLPLLRVFPVLCLLLLPTVAVAQSTGKYCEPGAAVKEDLKKVDRVNYENLPFKLRLERKITMLQELAKKYSGVIRMLVAAGF